MEERKWKLLFQLIMEHLQEESGDGDAHIICKYSPKEEVANKFESFLDEESKSKPFIGLKRYSNIHEKVILFSDGSNENVTFSNDQDNFQYPTWVGLVVKI